MKFSTQLSALTLALLASVWLTPAARAETFYVDYAAGDDARAGTSAAQSWKHFPSAKAAGGQAKTRKLAPGDTVIFKGGVEYPGEIALTASGAENKPIVLDGNSAGSFGTGQAIFNGAQKLSGWKPCASLEDAGGSPDWRSCWTLDLPEKTDPFAANLFYSTDGVNSATRGVVARNPNTPDAFWWQDLENFAPAPDGTLQPTSLQLPATMAAPAGQNWNGAFVGLWSNGNWIELRAITATSPDGKTVSFDKAAPRKTGNRVVLFNHGRLLDQRGEYVVTNDGQRLIFHNGTGNTAPLVQIAARRYAINLNGQSHVVMRGLTMRNFAGDPSDKRAGGGIISWAGQPAPNDIAIENCTVTGNQSLAKVAGLQMVEVNGLRITGCTIEDNQGSPGLLLSNCKNVVIARNTLARNGGSGMRIFGSQDVVIDQNTVRQHLGIHANGISVYLQSRNVKITRNIVENGRIALTLQSSQDVEADYNIFTTNSEDNPAVAVWPASQKLASMKNLTLRNNVIVNASNKGLTSSDKGLTGVRVINNIISGSLLEPAAAEAMSNNLYTTLSWQQSKPEWKWEEKALRSDDKSVFVDAAKGDFRLADGSPAIGAGVNWGQKTDLSGAPVQGTPNIGAYANAK